MGVGRYTFAAAIDGGRGKSNPRISSKINLGVVTGAIPVTTRKIGLNERLDAISLDAYGSASYWWVIAAASGIGWGMQVPPGTIIRIPVNLGQILAMGSS
tara:strand:- start:21 stop:320 length:300 start_codon:yes stop_codon:yes gene_type:complete